MAGYFEATSDGAAVALDEVEISILRSLTVQLLELIGPGDADSGSEEADPLDALFAEGPSEPPTDPALARLFPDAYGGGPGGTPEAETPEAQAEAAEARSASAEFRRYTETDLRAGKRDAGLTVVRSLDTLQPAEGGAVLTLGPEDSRVWLGVLNDLRLALGARLEITDDEDSGELYQLPDSDPRKPMVMAFLWLGGLQETLVETLLP
ncbi:DUF2017 domain-containing protein [Streptomyces sulphureus]|uniref:DUF2017 domain-containing protein n=1 Tax=Streptomyces sulphureus TaxID=47758 RepID=UPI00036C0A1E|nr:DUF2017 domain-containing protein [Streptomyces sulphureus]